MTRILIIDDSQVIRSLLKEYLTDYGYHVEMACDGQEGIDMALAGDYDVAFCDIHMPRKNGYQVFSEVSRRRPDIFFIMTDSLPDQLAEMATSEGAHCCLTKPFDLDQVKATLEGLLAKTRTV